MVALMEIQASRLAARLIPAGVPVPLLEQNRGHWDQLLIRRGFAALLRAERAAHLDPMSCRPPSPRVTPRYTRRSRPTGRASPRFTRRWPC
jgi:Family of unknown function (DUF6596)